MPFFKTCSFHRLFLPSMLIFTVIFSSACTVLPSKKPQSINQERSMQSEADDQWEQPPADLDRNVTNENELEPKKDVLADSADQNVDWLGLEQPTTDTAESIKEVVPSQSSTKVNDVQEPKIAPQSTTVGTRKKYKVIIPQENEAVSWYYMKQGKGQVPEFPVTVWFEASDQARWVGEGKTVYLTFDNGGGMGDLDKILSVLEKHEVKATFFITGNNMKRHPESLKKVVNAGHLVVNHSMTHRDFTKLDDATIVRELSETDQVYESIIGSAPKKLFRFPFGRFSPHILELVATQGYTTHFWSTAMKDWEPRTNGALDAYRDVMDNLHDGNVILLHQGSKDNSEGLDMIIQGIKEEGYTFGLADEL